MEHGHVYEHELDYGQQTNGVKYEDNFVEKPYGCKTVVVVMVVNCSKHHQDNKDDDYKGLHLQLMMMSGYKIYELQQVEKNDTPGMCKNVPYVDEFRRT